MLNPDYIVGLVDGEGSFTAYIKNPQSNKKVERRTKAEPRFYIKLIEKDKNILYELSKYFGCGSINISGDLRAIYKMQDNNIALFVDIDNHSNLYK